jgi:hypothetical protein
MRRTVGADVLRNTEGYIRGTNGHGPRKPAGAEDRRRAQGRVGNSGGPLDSSTDGGRMAQPAHWEDIQGARGSRMPSYERRGGVTPAEQRRAQLVVVISM